MFSVYRIQADETESVFSKTRGNPVLQLLVFVHFVLRWQGKNYEQITQSYSLCADEAGATFERSASLLR